ncbi:MAG TPA: DUF1254 domain-containing protein [Trebonia sp.]|nr:DUF1254 domain-containing protein [Trebonia sp.]
MSTFDGAGKGMPAFVPAPARIEESFGTLEFAGGGFADDATTRMLYDELDLQRATQAYLDFYPALSLFGILTGQVHDYGFRSCSNIGIFADFADAAALYLTANTDSVYATLTVDLKAEGPTVIEIPAGMFGSADDAYFRFIVDFGPTGPDQGAGGKYLLVPPGYEDEEPDGYIVVRSPTYRVWAMVRAPAELVGTGKDAMEWYRQNLRAYPLATGPRNGEYMNLSGRRFTQLPPEDATAFGWLDEIVQYEPDDLFSVEQRGRLATLGIRKGRPYAPDERMRGIFDRAGKLGAAMSRAVCFANRREDARYWPDRQWETAFSGTSDFIVDGALDPDLRTLWHYQAIVVSPAMASVREGVGSVYLGVCRDETGEYLDGARSYRLNVPADPPAKQFWSITLYDPATRSAAHQPAAPECQQPAEANAEPRRIRRHRHRSRRARRPARQLDRHRPGQGWFTLFRFYGPLRGSIDRTWKLGDLSSRSTSSSPT